MSNHYSPMNPWGPALDDVKFLRIFNVNAQYPAAGARFDRESAEYKHNAAVTYKVSTAFNAAAQAENLQTQYPISYGGEFWAGTNEIAVHKDDQPAIMKILDGLKAQGLIDRVEEIPREDSWTYATTQAKFTPH